MIVAPILALALAAAGDYPLTFNEDCRLVRDGHVILDGNHVDHGCIAVFPRDSVAKMVGRCSVAETKEGCEFSFDDDDAKFSQAPGAQCSFSCKRSTTADAKTK